MQFSKTSRDRVAYKFSCGGGDTFHVGETNRHLSTLVREHLTTEKELARFPTLERIRHVRDFMLRGLLFNPLHRVRNQGGLVYCLPKASFKLAS